MPEYTYLLETRLSSMQRNALAQVRDAAREAGMTVFLAGGAIRDLTTGSSVRDLDFAVQGNALLLEEVLRARGGELWGKHEPSRTLHFFFPGSVRVEVASTRSERFPSPGQPVYEWAGIVDDLHRRDFTANAMALSLNEGSYGLLLDPLNGVADIEARQLRLVSNYGFIEDPARLVRLVRLRQRLGWTVEDRTATRYENAKEADNFNVLSSFLRGYELEEIATEESAPAVLRALEGEGWMARLFPEWTSEAMDTSALDDLHRNRIQLLIQGIAPDLAAAHLELMTAKMPEKARGKLKATMVRPGLRAQWEGLDEAAKQFAQLLTGREAATPSATWKLFHAHAAEPILWLAHTRKGQAVETKFKNLFTIWPEAAKKVPVALMLELRITPELPGYEALLHELFLAQIDGKLDTDEALRAFLEPYSPPAPPPPVSLKRSRAKKSEGKAKRKSAARDDDDEDEKDLDDEELPEARDKDEDDEDEEDDTSGLPAELDLNRSLANVNLDTVLGRIAGDGDEDESEIPDEVEPPVLLNEAVEEPSMPAEQPKAIASSATAPGRAPKKRSEKIQPAPAEAKPFPAKTEQDSEPVQEKMDQPAPRKAAKATPVPAKKSIPAPAKKAPSATEKERAPKREQPNEPPAKGSPAQVAVPEPRKGKTSVGKSEPAGKNKPSSKGEGPIPTKVAGKTPPKTTKKQAAKKQ